LLPLGLGGRVPTPFFVINQQHVFHFNAPSNNSQFDLLSL
jgi:hypothetical protein